MSHDDELDRVLSMEDDISPSSGFVGAVMTSVHNEATAPKPIPFPWGRMVVGIGGAVASLATLVVAALRQGAAMPQGSGGETLRQFSEAAGRLAMNSDTQLVVGALVLTYLLVEVPRKVLRW